MATLSAKQMTAVDVYRLMSMAIELVLDSSRSIGNDRGNAVALLTYLRDTEVLQRVETASRWSPPEPYDSNSK